MIWVKATVIWLNVDNMIKNCESIYCYEPFDSQDDINLTGGRIIVITQGFGAGSVWMEQGAHRNGRP